MTQVKITELVLRDGHQSLIATRMRTEDMLPICSKLDNVGFWSLEAWGGATFDACVRFLKEDPWERLRKLRRALPNSRIQMLLRGQNLLGYRHYPDDLVRAFVQKSADNGVDVFRVFDAMNDLRNMRVSIEAVKAAGKHAEGTLSYTTSPVHNIDYFVSWRVNWKAWAATPSRSRTWPAC
jgi:pyruvate carboxylase subunit B